MALILDGVGEGFGRFTAPGTVQFIASGEFDSALLVVEASTDGLTPSFVYEFTKPGIFTYEFIEGTLIEVRTIGSTSTTDLSLSVYPTSIDAIKNLFTESGDQLITEAGDLYVTG